MVVNSARKGITSGTNISCHMAKKKARGQIIKMIKQTAINRSRRRSKEAASKTPRHAAAPVQSV